MDRVDYQNKAAGSVVSPSDFTVSDEMYFFGNGRLCRVRPPLPHECPELVASLRIIGYQSFLLVIRADMASPPRAVALLGLEGEAADALPGELARMGGEEMIKLTRRRDAYVVVLEGE